MKLALIGHGAMGKLVERLAKEKGHKITYIADASAADLSETELAEKLAGCDAVIDFSDISGVVRNIKACLAVGVPLVEGTTGWNESRDEIEKLVREQNGGMVHGANFSIGVNLFYRIVQKAALLFCDFPEYEIFIEEQHHSRKKDAPSGTALKLKYIVEELTNDVTSVASTRSGNIPGTHRVGFDGVADQVLLTHTARSRDGFALGAIMAAEWIAGKKGFYEFSEVIDEIV
jgi:4-hydroxy-tetrahydrodipicolinate reductase